MNIYTWMKSSFSPAHSSKIQLSKWMKKAKVSTNTWNIPHLTVTLAVQPKWDHMTAEYTRSLVFVKWHALLFYRLWTAAKRPWRETTTLKSWLSFSLELVLSKLHDQGKASSCPCLATFSYFLVWKFIDEAESKLLTFKQLIHFEFNLLQKKQHNVCVAWPAIHKYNAYCSITVRVQVHIRVLTPH